LLWPNGIILRSRSREQFSARAFITSDIMKSLVLSHLLWKVGRHYPDDSIAVANRDRWLIRLSKYYWSVIAGEYYGTWPKYYLPPHSKDVHNMTVLDLGAGWGETDAFYFDHGAKKIIAVEANKSFADRIRMNASLNDWPIEVIDRPFDISMLSRHEIDLCKFDIELGEKEFLKLDRIPFHLVGEVHTSSMLGNMLKKFPDFFIRKTLYSEEFGNVFYVYK
jgi:hypothetical protein